MKTIIKYWFFVGWFTVSCSQKKAIVPEQDTIIKVSSQLSLKDTLPELNTDALSIYKQKFTNEIKITTGDKKYLNCGYSDPLHQVFECFLKKIFQMGFGLFTQTVHLKTLLLVLNDMFQKVFIHNELIIIMEILHLISKH